MEIKEKVKIVNKYVSQENMSENVLEIFVNKFMNFLNSASSTLESTKKEKIAG